jgi:hypothetical protein
MKTFFSRKLISRMKRFIMQKIVVFNDLKQWFLNFFDHDTPEVFDD